MSIRVCPSAGREQPPERLEIRGAVAKGSDVEVSRTHRLTTHGGCTRNNGPSTRMRSLPIGQNDPGPISRAGVASLAAHGAGKGGNPAVPASGHVGGALAKPLRAGYPVWQARNGRARGVEVLDRPQSSPESLDQANRTPARGRAAP